MQDLDAESAKKGKLRTWLQMANGTSADLSSSNSELQARHGASMTGWSKSGPIFRAPDSKLGGRQVTDQPRTTSLKLRHSHERSKFLEIHSL